MTASNTKECFRECVGMRIKGVLFDALPLRRPDLSAGSRTLVFEDGSGLTIAANGSFWREPAREIDRAIDEMRAKLEANKALIQDTLTAAGATA